MAEFEAYMDLVNPVPLGKGDVLRAASAEHRY